jgi:hypothetical protein
VSARRLAAVFLLSAVVGACSQPADPPPKPQVALLSTAASSNEDTDPQIFRLDLTLANVGQVAAPLGTVEVVNAGLYKGPQLRIRSPEFVAGAEVDLSPVAKGETRVLTFLGSDRNLHLCPRTCDQNPHLDLVQLDATVVSDAGQWFFHVDVAVTCANELPRMCKVDLAEGCQGTDVAGQPLRCLPTWTEVLSDNLCGTVESDLITKCVGGKAFRTIRVAGVDYHYNYPQGALTGVTSSNDGCLAGPCAGSPVPPAGECETAKAFYECGAAAGGGGDT